MDLDLEPAGRPGDDLDRPPPPTRWRDRIEDVADATGVTPARLIVGAILLAVALGVGWWLLRPPPAPTELSLPYAPTTAATIVGARTSTTGAPADVVVHVAGAVARPGVQRLPAGARVTDAVEAAGGLRADADPSRVNLAAPLSDGERIYLPAVGEPVPPLIPTASAGSPGADGEAAPVNLNSATPAELEALPGVGPATASAIIEHRDVIGGFTSVDQLLDVRGIGDAKLERLRPLVQVP